MTNTLKLYNPQQIIFSELTPLGIAGQSLDIHWTVEKAPIVRVGRALFSVTSCSQFDRLSWGQVGVTISLDTGWPVILAGDLWADVF